KERLVNVKLKDIDAWTTEHLSKNWVTERTKTLKQVSYYWNIELDTLSNNSFLFECSRIPKERKVNFRLKIDVDVHAYTTNHK
ncbi:hypothetical protein, partial [Segatella copri]|uniref:hypothetical protein n=1 Tax=Segatella copri TaxID=165179 RepID=UPI003F8B98F6